MNEVTLEEIVLPKEGLLRGPFGGDLKKEIFVAKSNDTYKVYEQGVVLQENPQIGRYYITKEYFEKKMYRFSVRPKDFLVSCSGVNYGAIYQLEENIEPGVINQALLRIRVDENLVYDRYFYYLFKNYLVKKIVGRKGDSTIPNFPSINIIKKLKLTLPDINTQRKIADALDSIRQKIELNNKIISELESLAKTIYDFWFVQFDFPDENGRPYKSSGGKMVWSEELKREVPEGWEVKKVGDLVDVKRGKNITRKTVVDGDIPVIAAGLEPSCYHNVSNTSSPVITVSGSGANAGYIQLHYKEIWASDCSYIDQTMFSQIHFMYLFLRSKQNEVYDMQKGSAQPHVYPQDIMGIKVLVDKELKMISRFETLVVSLYKQIGKSKVQNQKLSDLRDWLLPMLINGQVSIKDKIS